MANFPSLSSDYSIADFSQDMVVDPVHRANFESGAILTRTRSTAVPRRLLLVYSVLTDTDKIALETFERDTIGYGGAEFNWYDIKSNKTYVSKLLGPIVYQFNRQSAGNFWSASFELAIIRET